MEISQPSANQPHRETGLLSKLPVISSPHLGFSEIGVQIPIVISDIFFLINKNMAHWKVGGVLELVKFDSLHLHFR